MGTINQQKNIALEIKRIYCSLRRAIFIITTITLLTSCGSTLQIKNVSPELDTSSAQTSYTKGYKLLTEWEQGKGNNKKLKKALTLLTEALKENPNNVYYQLAHYNAFSGLAKLQDYYDESSVLTVYNSLNPILYDELASPAFYSFYLSRKNKQPLDTQLAHIKRAISQNPMNPQNWSYLSRIYEKKDLYWLSVAAAKRAIEILPNIDYYLFQIGYNLDNVAQTRDCVYDEKHLSQRSAHYLTQAVSKNINEVVYLDNQGFQYLQLGIVPLAYQQIKKAFELQPSIWIAMHYAEAAILMKRYTEAEIAANYLMEHDSKLMAHNYLAMVYISENKKREAAPHIVAARNNGFATFYGPAQIWLLEFTEQESRALFQHADKQILDDSPLLDFINENSSTSIVEFLPDAQSSCDHSIRDFFIAQKFWQRGNDIKTKEYLQKIKKTGTTRELSYLWASVLLDSRYAN